MASGRAGQALHGHALWSALTGLIDSATPPRFVVAWSGGMDSTVLLHCLHRLQLQAAQPMQLRAVHVNHQLQPAAAEFSRYCRKWARAWNIPLTVLRPPVARAHGGSLEEAAREARYAALACNLADGEYLLSAQHADDQLETVLLALLRGAGPKGLAAMPARSRLGRGWLLRPCLGLEREALLRYARLHALSWVEDPTNNDMQFDRNYLRAQLVPVLKARWPAAAITLGRSARHAATAAAAIQRQAAMDLAAASDGADLDIAVFSRFAAPRRREVLRFWLQSRGWRAPDERRLQQLEHLLAAREDALPQLVLPEGQVRRFAGRLVLCEQRQEMAATKPGDAAAPAFRQVSWQWQKGPLNLPSGRRLVIQPERHGDLDLAKLPRQIDVLACAALIGTRGQGIRKLLQTLDVPWWERAELPILLSGPGSAAPALAIADLWLAPAVQSDAATRRRGRIFWR